MKLPNAELARIERGKLVDYLLNLDSPRGRGKARFFLSRGFTREDWRVLQQAFMRHAREHEVGSTQLTEHGMKFSIEGEMATPDGRVSLVRSTWIIRPDEDFPRLTSAYPRERRRRR